MTTGVTLPWYTGSQTFMKSPLIELDQVERGMVVIGGAPHDSTHSSRFGTRMGPRGIREGSLAFADKLQNAGEQGFLDVNTGTHLTLPAQNRLGQKVSHGLAKRLLISSPPASSRGTISTKLGNAGTMTGLP